MWTFKSRVIVLFFILFNISCGQSNFRSISTDGSTDFEEKQPTVEDPGDDDIVGQPPEQKPVVVPVIEAPSMTICSKLDFTGVSWPKEIPNEQHAYLELALNITGSFEGNTGWANLSNNFDGMGVSLGILQQNLGQGSLQPIWINLLRAKVPENQIGLSSSQSKFLKSMMNLWIKDISQDTGLLNDDLFFNDSDTISQFDDQQTSAQTLDDNQLKNDETMQAQSITTSSQKSVSKALNEFYFDNGQTFKPAWKNALINWANSNAYKSEQIKTAARLYSKAIQYFEAFKLSELRSLLLMFDFVVQNGGFKQKVLKDYRVQLEKNPSMNETDRDLLILQIRLRDVNARWQNDVSSRKKTIINSIGIVHGDKRNLTKEYCYDSTVKVLTKP